MSQEDRARRIGRVSGVVQGVGFRPFVARLARELALTGSVRNDGARVVIDLEGSVEALEQFAARVVREAPAAARIEEVSWVAAEGAQRDAFVIERSHDDAPASCPIPPDLATCAECLAEVRDPSARRHGYPFTNCTACGPRYTIVTGLPYDRPRTTMAGFPLCEACTREYADEGDRRYHAQPIACPRCGPHLRLLDCNGALQSEREAALGQAARALQGGAILALKGLGGFQLLCDARDEAVVQRLRARKRREAKPLAVLVGSLEAARRIALLTDADADALTSPAAPIVLVRRRADGGLAASMAPGLRDVGVMLPTTPLHHRLCDAVPFPLVCTSGNLHDEPIAIDDDEALSRLSAVMDLVLTHDRPIARRADDGVVQVIDGVVRVLRLGRGLGPRSVAIAGGDDRSRLLAGTHLKNAPGAYLEGHAVLWPHVGDLDAPLARDALSRSMEELCAFLRLEPREVVCDAHPDYASTRWAEASGLPVRRVYHHEAHVAACLAEHGVDDALGLAWDGTGLGRDGTAWGGEAFLVRHGTMTRVGSLRAFPLPGGDAAARDGRRALAGLAVAVNREQELAIGETAHFVDVARSRLAVPTSSVGRLFDAVAALLGVRERSAYEGQAAMELEALAETGHAPYPFRLVDGVLDWAPMIDPLLADRADPVRASSRFHATLVAWIVELATAHRASTVALSGGCFQNVRLTVDTISALRSRVITPLLPTHVPVNDGGLALGQAWLSARSTGATTRS